LLPTRQFDTSFIGYYHSLYGYSCRRAFHKNTATRIDGPQDWKPKTLALSPFAMDHSDCDVQQLLNRSDSPAIKCPMPSQVIGQIARCHAMKVGQPLPEATMIGIDVLHVDRPVRTGANPLPGAQINGLVCNAMLPRKGTVGGIRIRHQKRLRRQPWQHAPVWRRARHSGNRAICCAA
jgi:hypothetical protein